MIRDSTSWESFYLLKFMYAVLCIACLIPNGTLKHFVWSSMNELYEFKGTCKTTYMFNDMSDSGVCNSIKKSFPSF